MTLATTDRRLMKKLRDTDASLLQSLSIYVHNLTESGRIKQAYANSKQQTSGYHDIRKLYIWARNKSFYLASTVLERQYRKKNKLGDKLAQLTDQPIKKGEQQTKKEKMNGTQEIPKEGQTKKKEQETQKEKQDKAEQQEVLTKKVEQAVIQETSQRNQ